MIKKHLVQKLHKLPEPFQKIKTQYNDHCRHHQLVFAFLQKQNCSQLALCSRKMLHTFKLHSCRNTSCPNLSQVLLIRKINYHRQADT